MSVEPRSRSPSPTASPSVALSACPNLDSSISTISTVTSVSNASSATGQAQDVVASKRRGYTRPQATIFADSARNRDSVMCLGTIAHLQYYFARTGLLDGKGAQLAREEDQKQKRPSTVTRSVSATVLRPVVQQKPPQPKPRAVSDIYNKPTIKEQQPIALPKLTPPKPVEQPKPKPVENPIEKPIEKPKPAPLPQTVAPSPPVIEAPKPVIDPTNYDPFNYTQYPMTTGISSFGKSRSSLSLNEPSVPAVFEAAIEPEPASEPLPEPTPAVDVSVIEPPMETVEEIVEPEVEPEAEPEVEPTVEAQVELEPITLAVPESTLSLEPETLSQSNISTQDSIFDSISPVASPSEASSEVFWEDDLNPALNLPPTVSTYKQKSTYIPPPPSLAVLRRELREALEDAHRLFKDLEFDAGQDGEEKDPEQAPGTPRSPSTGAWHQAQGLQVLDLSTLAIRAAKNYYTAHEHPQRLYSIKSERMIRSDLYNVLEVLKKLAARNFAGGVRRAEIARIEDWMTSIGQLVDKDEAKENEEYERRQKCTWLDGNWAGKERDREWLFLRSYDKTSESLPSWTPQGQALEPSEFLKAMQTGLRLVHLHNELVKNSARHFEEIKTFHTDTGKPYRCAENLRFWIKAAELRWDVMLNVDVSGVVNGRSEAWQAFDEAILLWSKTVREQIVREWKEHRETLSMEKPILRMAAAVPW